MLRVFAGLLCLFLLGLQITWWFGKGGLRDASRLEAQIEAQEKELEALRLRNGKLAAEVVNLKEGLEAIEEIARSEMGMVREGETFYQIIDPVPELGPAAQDSASPATPP
ncbi:MAG: cell division protein FtsB [Gammaproteobacteria bacterium]|nr:cell division protein FtsB [Gammaproteobacteria bacterium]